MPASEVPDDLISPYRAAEILHCHYTTVRAAIRRGELAGYQVTRGATMLSEREVRAHIKPANPMVLDAYVARVVAAAPRLTDEQIARLRALLPPVGRHGKELSK